MMSYPQPVYRGDGGEFSAVFRGAGQAAELPMKTADASYLATGASTHGQFGLYRRDFKGAGAPREGYFEGLAGLAGLSDAEQAAFMLHHDTFWL